MSGLEAALCELQGTRHAEAIEVTEHETTP
jgi:hypothetical protein